MLRHKTTSLICLIAIVLLTIASLNSLVSPWSILIVGVFWLGLTSLGVFDIRLSYFIPVFYRKKTDDNTIALTFDDGPTSFTPAILDLLDRYDAKATFFCIGQQMEQYPEIVSRIHQEGHLIGNHTYSHSNFFGFFGSSKVKTEIHKTDLLIRKNTQKENQYFRPPFGITNPHIAKALKQTGHLVIGWNIRSLDTVIGDKNKILDRITKKLKPGSIVLLHDTSEKTVAVLEQLLHVLEKKNYTLVTIEKLLKDE